MDNTQDRYKNTIDYIKNISFSKDLFLFVIATLIVVFVVSNIGEEVDDFLGFKVSNFIEMYSIILIYPLYKVFVQLSADYIPIDVEKIKK